MSRTLDHLLDRNVAWAQAKTGNDPRFFQRMAEQQTPKYLWIGCSDSRVTANDVLSLDPGEVFVHRNIANVVHTSDLNILSVLEFAVEHLLVEHIIVCGHTGCGGIERALSEERGAMVDHWLQPITMFYRKHRAHLDLISPRAALVDRMCELNIEMQVRRIATTPIVENAWSRGASLHLHGWIYGMPDGLIRDLGPHLSSTSERDALPSIDQRAYMPREAESGVRRHAIDAFSDPTLDDMALQSCCTTDQHR
jgi:carbonic anhydrase